MQAIAGSYGMGRRSPWLLVGSQGLVLELAHHRGKDLHLVGKCSQLGFRRRWLDWNGWLHLLMVRVPPGWESPAWLVEASLTRVVTILP